MTQATTGTNTQVFIATPAAPDVFTLVEELNDVQPIRNFDVVEVTNFNSQTDKEFVKGLRNPGRYTMRGNWITNAAGQIILRQAFEDKRPYWFKIILPPNPGDGAGETWYFKALVLSSDPVRIAPGAKLEFESLLQATGRRTPGPIYTNASGQIGFTSSRPLGQKIQATMWSGFQLSSTLPADAEITGMYPTLVCSANFDGTQQYLEYGPSMVLGDPVSGAGFINPFGGAPGSPNTSFASMLFYALSIGTTLATLTDQNIQMILNTSLFLDGLTDLITATAAGIAIYYESDSPVTDMQIPAPITVPAGQGVAWAIPFGVSVIGPNSQGFSTGAAASLDLTQNA